jgi:hypothetical protein
MHKKQNTEQGSICIAGGIEFSVDKLNLLEGYIGISGVFKK